jgi:hypothetical protein
VSVPEPEEEEKKTKHKKKKGKESIKHMWQRKRNLLPQRKL